MTKLLNGSSGSRLNPVRFYSHIPSLFPQSECASAAPEKELSTVVAHTDMDATAPVPVGRATDLTSVLIARPELLRIVSLIY